IELATALAGFGRHWADAGSGRSGTLEAEKSYDLSKPTEELDHFLSHDWQTSRWTKYITLILLFNTKPAMLACFCASAVMTAREMYRLASLVVGDERVVEPWTASVPLAVWYIFLFYGHVIRSWFCKPVLVFLDKLCIAQHDLELKEKGIKGLAGFIVRSKTLTVLWSSRYLTRLWCTYEIAAFLRDDLENNRGLQIMPVRVGILLILQMIVSQFAVGAYHFFLYLGVYTGDITHLRAVQVGAYSVGLPLAALTIAQVYVGIDLVEEVVELPRQLSNFSIRQSECFCCSNDHCHPDTGEVLPCDRRLVYGTLRKWYCSDGEVNREASSSRGLGSRRTVSRETAASRGTRSEDKASRTSSKPSRGDDPHLDAFDKLVQTRLRERVQTLLGSDFMLPFDLLVCMVASPSVCLLPWYSPTLVFEWDVYDFDYVDEQLRMLIREFVTIAKHSVVLLFAAWCVLVLAKAGVLLKRRGFSRLLLAMVSAPIAVLMVVLMSSLVDVCFYFSEKDELLPLPAFCAEACIVGYLFAGPRWLKRLEKSLQD
ncbi:unnamed protein product, partial [Symbiodinium natans]